MPRRRWELSGKKLQASEAARTPSGSLVAMPFGKLRAGFLRMTAVAAVAMLTSCRSTQPPKPLAQLTAEEQAGHAAYTARCATCHYDRETGSLHGPSLAGVYQKPYLPSGAPANDERIRATILHGRGNMPALGDVVGDDEVTSILAYLKTL